MRSSIFIAVLLLLYACSTLLGEETIGGPTMPEMRATILDMANKDQAIRKRVIGNVSLSAELAKKINDVDKYNTEMVKKIYAKNGWPNTSMIGRDGVNAFWLLVQHATYFEFQRSLLPSIKTAFSEGNIDAQNYALFVDRLLVNDGKPQKYGTQVKGWNNKMPIPFAIENPSQVNTVRKSIGLFNLEDYLLLVKEAHFPAEKSDSLFNNSAAKGNEGWIGMQLDINGSGPIDNMTIKSLTVYKITKESPAAKAGLQLGDQVIEIEGLTVEGNNSAKLMPVIDKPIGDKLTLVVKRRDGTRHKITIVITARSLQKRGR